MTKNTECATDAPTDLTGLSAVIGAGPAAVLVVDLAARQVVHTNPVADQLAPGLPLPLGLDQWSDAAALRDLDGAELSETGHPLSRITRAEPVLGQAVSAARRSELGSRREPLWVVAVPMAGAPMLDEHALVVLFPLRDAQAAGWVLGGPEDTGLSNRAVRATTLSFTVADARADDQPLVWVNPAFTAATGYELDDALGRNCRFLQGTATDPEAVRRIRDALDAGEAVTETLLNYRKDGRPFWNQVDISPVLGPGGEVTHFVGIQTDVSDRVDADHARDRAHEAERVARATAEAAQARLRFLIDAVSSLGTSLDPTEVRRRLVDLVLPGLADWVLVVHRDDHGPVAGVEGTHRDSDLQPRVDELCRRLPDDVGAQDLSGLFLSGSDVRRLCDLDRPSASHDALSAHLARLGGRSAMYVALPGRHGVDELLVLVRDSGREQFTDDDVEVGRDLGRRVGLILDNARLFEVQRRIAETLQRSLLPDVPAVEGLTVAARYRAGTVGAEVGGDFYEVLDLPGADVGFAVGDVNGHDVLAAAAMGHLKGMLRACAYEAATTPSLVLQRVDSMIAGLGMPTIATALYAHLSRHGTGWRLVWSNAGHPPLVARLPDGTVELLHAARTEVLLGLDSGPRLDTVRDLPSGTTLVGYTDGLVERRSETLDVGLDRLREAVRTGPDDVEALCEHLLVALDGDRRDDVAVVALCLGEHDPG